MTCPMFCLTNKTRSQRIRIPIRIRIRAGCAALLIRWQHYYRYCAFFPFFFPLIPFIIFALRPSFSLSLVVVTQIRGHITGSSPPLPTTVRALQFYREKISALPLSTRVELCWSRATTQIEVLDSMLNASSKVMRLTPVLEIEIGCPILNRDFPDASEIEIAFYLCRFSILNRDRKIEDRDSFDLSLPPQAAPHYSTRKNSFSQHSKQQTTHLKRKQLPLARHLGATNL